MSSDICCYRYAESPGYPVWQDKESCSEKAIELSKTLRKKLENHITFEDGRFDSKWLSFFGLLFPYEDH